MLSTLRGLLAYAKPFWPFYLVGALAVIGTNLCDLSTTFVVRYAVNTIDRAPGAPLPDDSVHRWLADRAGEDQALVVALACGLVALVTLQGALRVIWRWGFIFSSLKVARDLRRQLFAHLQRQDHAYYDRAQTGELLSVATADIEAMRMFLGPGLLLIIDNVLYFSMVPAVMLWIDWELTLIVALPLPLIPLLTSRVGNLVHSRFSDCQDQLAKLAAFAQEAVGGVAVTKGFVQEAAQERAFGALSEACRDKQVHLAYVQAMFMPMLTLLVGLEIMLVMYFGGARVVDGRLNPGQFFQFLMMTLMLTFPMMGLGWTLMLYHRGSASYARYEALMGVEPVITDDPARATREAVAGEVAIRDLTFAYPEGDGPVLRDVTLVVPRGHTVGLVGEVGAGKSTLARLIPRFYDAPEGTVTVDGHDVRDYPLAVLRRAIGVVPQRTFLFSASIHDNIALGAPDASRADVERAAELAGLADDIAEFDDGFDTTIGERGVNLSGGQRQRLAIARALLTTPRILILDDCLSAVDTKTEDKILGGLAQVTDGVTTVVVAHRLSTVQRAHEICVLDGGRIVERGTHDQLLAAGGWYAQTWQQQQLTEAGEQAVVAAAAEAASASGRRAAAGPASPEDGADAPEDRA